MAVQADLEPEPAPASDGGVADVCSNSRPRPEADVVPKTEPPRAGVLPEVPVSHTLNPWAPAFFPTVPLPPEAPGREGHAPKASQEGQHLADPLEEWTPTVATLGLDPPREGGSATMQKFSEMEGSLQLRVCPQCCLLLDIAEFGPGQNVCFGCSSPHEGEVEQAAPNMADLGQAAEEEPDAQTGERPPNSDQERQILSALVASERARLADPLIIEWGASWVVYAAENGRRYRVELPATGPLQQICRDTGRERGVIREPVPERVGVMPWVRYVLPGATYLYEAVPRADVGKLLPIDTRYVAYPESVSRAVDVLHQARMRVLSPMTEGLVLPEEVQGDADGGASSTRAADSGDRIAAAAGVAADGEQRPLTRGERQRLRRQVAAVTRTRPG